MTSVDVNRRPLRFQHPHGVVNEIHSLLLQGGTEAAHSSQCVGLENYDRSPVAKAVGEGTNPPLVGVAAIRAPG